MQINRQIEIDAPKDTVFAIISDFESYPDFLPEISKAVIIDRRENSVDVEFEIDIIMKISYSLSIQLNKPDTITWQLLYSKTMNENSGSWTLVAADEGKTTANYQLSVKLPGILPRSVSDKLTQINLTQTLEQFKIRCETTKA